MTKQKKNTTKLNKQVIIISIILMIIAFTLRTPLVLRPILWIVAIIILAIDIKATKKVKTSKLLLIIVALFLVSIILDGITVITLKRIPVFAYNIVNTEKTRVYNGIGIRVWQCDKNDFSNLIVDPFYKKGYMCDAEDIAAIDANSFLNSVVENYEDYKNTYIKIKGKISKKNGQNYIEMKPYETTNITLNGYVNFADNITLRILFQNNTDELDSYDVYDEITVVGIVKNLDKENEKYIIYMYDSKVVSNMNLNEYEITATSEKKCSKEKTMIYSNEANSISTYCLEEIIVSYGDGNKYELATALSANKITIENLKANPIEIKQNEETKDTLYRFDNYSILFCNPETSKEIIIGNKNMTFSSVTCQTKVEG